MNHFTQIESTDISFFRFFITLAPCPHLNGKHTVFGHVVSGHETVDRIAKSPIDSKDRPLSEIIISHCGELERRKKIIAPAVGTDPSSKRHTPDNRYSEDHSPPTNRGRKHTKRSQSTASSSQSHSPPHRHKDKHRRISNPRHPRRRSDATIDETRRGRSPTWSPSDDRSPARASHHHRPKKRSPPPSRPRSRSPHMRRRRSRSRSRSPRRWRDRSRNRQFDSWRPGTGRFSRNSSERRRARDQSRDFDDTREERVWGGDHSKEFHENEGGRMEEVHFKGRGSMKYRERRW